MDYSKEARKALNAGDLLRAGDMFMLAGKEEEALQAYLQGKHFASAARLLEKRGDFRAAARHYSQAEKYEKAADLFIRSKDFANASEMFARIGDWSRACEMAVKAGDPARGAEYAEQGGFLDRAVDLYTQIQKYEKAADLCFRILAQLKKDREGDHLESHRARIHKFANHAGTLLMKLGQYEKAASCFEQVENRKGAAEAWMKAGQMERAAEFFASAEDFVRAASCYEKASQWLLASQMAEKAGEFERAAVLAEKAGHPLRAAPLFVQAEKIDRAADIYFQQLIKAMEQKAALTDTQKNTLKKLSATAGSLYLKLNNIKKAAWCLEAGENYTRAAELYLQANLPLKAGELYHRAGNHQKALELLMKAPDQVKPELLGDVFFHTGKYTEAGDLYMMARLPAKAAMAYEKAGNLTKAALLYQDIHQYDKAAELYEAMNELRKAADLYIKAKMFFQAGRIYESLGQMDAAMNCYLQTEEHFHTAELLLRMGKRQEAAHRLLKIAADDPRYPEAAVLMGEIFFEIGNYEKAVEKLSEVLAMEPVSAGNLELYYKLAVAREKIGQEQQAQHLFQKIFSIQEDFRDVRQRLPSVASKGFPPERLRPTTTHLVGKQIREYQILELVGKGGFGAVYKARHIFLQKDRAIKVIESRLNNADFAERFIREARILSDLQHPHLVQLFEFGQLDENQFFMVLEFIQGESVKERIRRQGALSIEEAIRITCEAATGLQVAHEKGIIHRDISPDNLMLVKDSSGREITKVIDFGIAKPLTDRETYASTEGDAFLGKPEFASPEQCGFLKPGEEIDARSDIFSLGITFYMMLTGRIPFSSPTPQGYLIKHLNQSPPTLGPNFPARLEKVLQKALSADRRNRHSSMAELIRDLQLQ